MYRLLKEYLRDVLRNAGYKVKVDYPFEMGWIDVFAGRTAFEITNHPNHERFKRYRYRCVVIGKNDESADGVIYTTQDEIHTTLAELFGCDFPSFRDWLDNFSDKDEEFYKKSFSFMKDRYGNTIAKKLLEAMVFIYTSNSVIDDHSGRVSMIPYSALFSYLVELGLAIRDTKEIFKPKTFMISLTREGVKLAKFEIYRRLEEYEDLIYKIVREHNGLYIALLGLSDRRGLVLKDVDFERVNDFYDLITKIRLDDLLVLTRGLTPIQAFCRALCYTVLFEEIREFFESLFKLRLAFRIPVYDYYCSFFGYEYRIPKEVASFLSNMLYTEINEKTIDRFQSLVDMFSLKYRQSEELELALEKGLVRLCAGGIEIVDRERFENFARVRFAKILSEFCEVLK